MQMFFELAINAVETFLTIDFLTKYLEPKFTGNRKIIAFLIGWLSAFTEICIVNSVTVFETFGTYIHIAVYFIYSLVFLQGGILRKLWASFLIQTIVTVIAIGTNLGVCTVIGYDPLAMITVFNNVRVIAVIITKVLLFYVTRVILSQKHKSPLRQSTWINLMVIPVISIISLCALMKAAMADNGINVYILTGMACIVISNIMTYYFYIVISRDYATKLENKLLKQQKESIDKVVESSEAFVEQMRAVRHDLRNHLFVISSYLHDENINEAQQYIENIHNDCIPVMQSLIYTGDDVFDAIINAKVAVCNQKKIFIQIKISPDYVNKLDKTETAIVFGNLLDNAIEAADLSVQKRIFVIASQREAYMSITVKNSIKESVLDTNSSLVSSKQDKDLHGIGIKNIKAIVKKHEGMIQFYEESGDFCCHILL